MFLRFFVFDLSLSLSTNNTPSLHFIIILHVLPHGSRFPQILATVPIQFPLSLSISIAQVTFDSDLIVIVIWIPKGVSLGKCKGHSPMTF